MDDFTRLDATSHMLEWLAEDPRYAIRTKVASILNQQVPDSQLIEFVVSSDPQWLTGAVPSEADPNKAILVRTGVAFEFALSVREPSGATHQLNGTYSWVGVNLNDPENAEHRVWLDVDGTLDEFGSEAELMNRMYFA